MEELKWERSTFYSHHFSKI